MERGESSGSDSSGDDVWAKLVPLDPHHLDIELRSNDITICLEIKNSSSEEQELCKITRNKDLVSALMQNKSSNLILVDDTVVQENDTIIIRCGSEIILGPEDDGFMKYRFKVMPSEELCKKQLKDMQQSDMTLRRSSEDIALLDFYASIKSPLVISSRRKFNRKRARTPSDEENVRDFPCPQCGTEYTGFQCNQSTIHLQCQTCGGMMPSRANTSVPQHCLGCDRAFCGAYWHAMGVTENYVHPVCSNETLKPVAERTVTRIPFLAHEKNRHEQDITEKCIRQMGKSLPDVISEWVIKLNDREIDRTRLSLNHNEMITPQTHLCNDCYEKLISFLLYWFRITLPKHFLPPEAMQRENCWYGSACRTQHHNEEHARKRNHVCRPTRGTRM